MATATLVLGAFETLTTQELLSDGFRTFGVQTKETGTGGADSASVAVLVEPLKAAVNVAVASAEIVPAEAVKLADNDPAATVTEAGMETKALSFVRFTTWGEKGAAERVTTQEADSPENNISGVHASDWRTGRGVSERETDLVTPASVAVIVAVELVVKEPVAAVKLALDWPDGTVTVAGTVSRVVLEVRATAVADGAFPDRVTEQVVLLEALTVEGEHVRPVKDTLGGGADTVTVPFAVAIAGVSSPVGRAPVTRVTVRVRAPVTDADGVTETTATTPSLRVVVFRPQITQSSRPALARHFKDLLRLVLAVPAEAVALVKSDEGNVIEN